jgi:hypothetical protein
MFDVCLKDLSQVPIVYKAISGADAWATKVKQPLALPWLEIVAVEEDTIEIYLLSDSETSRLFATEANNKRISSITCRSYSQEKGCLETIKVNQVVQLEDSLNIRYKDSQGQLRDPLWLELDTEAEKKPYQVLLRTG